MKALVYGGSFDKNPDPNIPVYYAAFVFASMVGVIFACAGGGCG